MNERPPLTFYEIPDHDGDGNTLYPFKVVASRALSREESRACRGFCLETFGQGGRIPEPGNRWFADEERGYFSFTTVTDRTVFLVGMTG